MPFFREVFKVFKPVERLVSNTAQAVGIHNPHRTVTVEARPMVVSTPTVTNQRNGSFSCPENGLTAALVAHSLPPEIVPMMMDNNTVTDSFCVEYIVSGQSTYSLYAVRGTKDAAGTVSLQFATVTVSAQVHAVSDTINRRRGTFLGTSNTTNSETALRGLTEAEIAHVSGILRTAATNALAAIQ